MILVVNIYAFSQCLSDPQLLILRTDITRMKVALSLLVVYLEDGALEVDDHVRIFYTLLSLYVFLFSCDSVLVFEIIVYLYTFK